MKFLTMSSEDSLPHCCGVNDVGGFETVQREWTEGWPHFDNVQFDKSGNQKVVCSGTGLFTATFINNAVCRQAYDYLCKEHTLLFQSPNKKNNNSGREVFLCVFLHKNRTPVFLRKNGTPSKRGGKGEAPKFAFPSRPGEKLPSMA